VQVVGGSNPLAPTNRLIKKGSTYGTLFLFWARSLAHFGASRNANLRVSARLHQNQTCTDSAQEFRENPAGRRHSNRLRGHVGRGRAAKVDPDKGENMRNTFAVAMVTGVLASVSMTVPAGAVPSTPYYDTQYMQREGGDCVVADATSDVFTHAFYGRNGSGAPNTTRGLYSPACDTGRSELAPPRIR
jgi:hypothetical protein